MPDATPTGALRLSEDGRRVVLPDGEVLDLSRRRAPRLILQALMENRGAALSWAALQAAGWPGEQMGAQSGRTRVHTAIYTLRKMGFEDLLVRRDDGYMLHPSVPVQGR